MERRPALALAAAGALVAAAAVATATSGLLHADSASDAGWSPTTLATADPGTAGAPLDPVVVTVTRDVYDAVVVPGGAPAGAGSRAAAGGGGSPSAAPSTTPSGSGQTGTDGPSPTTTVAVTPTTQPGGTTSTTRPPGVPNDWPADRPIPPMPEGCQKPQLEDNGEWNCDH